MTKISLNTLFVLLALTVLSVLCSSIQQKYAGAVILSLSLLKFFGVAFQFMELKHAHPFWKYLLVVFGSVFIILILCITHL
ncbi:MAG: cytochrome C oxidase subunit IV family protein [Flavobacteriaceae bacterium]